MPLTIAQVCPGATASCTSRLQPELWAVPGRTPGPVLGIGGIGNRLGGHNTSGGSAKLATSAISSAMPQALSPALCHKRYLQRHATSAISSAMPQALSPALCHKRYLQRYATSAISSAMPQALSPALCHKRYLSAMPQALSPALCHKRYLQRYATSAISSAISSSMPQALSPALCHKRYLQRPHPPVPNLASAGRKG